MAKEKISPNAAKAITAMRKNLASPKGRRELEEAIERACEACSSLRDSARVDERLLHAAITL